MFDRVGTFLSKPHSLLRVLLILMPLAFGLGQVITNREPKVVYLPPKAFPELPANLLKELRRRSCGVPQPPPKESRQNVIRGEFANPGQVDWAVMCSRGSLTRILVFWNGSETNPSELQASRFTPYGWQIDAVGKDFMQEQRGNGALPIRLEHQGIVWSTSTDATTFYFDGTAWRILGHRIDRIY